MKKSILFIFLLITILSFGQRKVAVKTTGIADEVLLFSSNGSVDKTIKFVNTPQQADFVVYLGKIKRMADVVVSRFGNVDKTYKIKYFGLADYKYKIVDSYKADISIYISSSPKNAIYISTYDALMEEEIIATIHEKLKSFTNK